MSGMICKSCGSKAIRALNVGFDGWFLALWAACAAATAFGASILGAVFLVAAGAKTVLALFRWQRACKKCQSSDVIPADSPVGRKLASSCG